MCRKISIKVQKINNLIISSFFTIRNVFIELFVYIFASINKLLLRIRYNRGKTMRKSDFKLSLNAIRKANEKLSTYGSGIAYSAPKNAGITIKTRIDGVERVREISKSDISKSYSKALKSYATKI